MFPEPKGFTMVNDDIFIRISNVDMVELVDVIGETRAKVKVVFFSGKAVNLDMELEEFNALVETLE